jgi:hypothetical protein
MKPGPDRPLRKIDGQFVAPHATFRRYRLAKSGRRRRETTTLRTRHRDRAYRLAHQLVGLIPDGLDRFEKNSAAILAANLFEPLFAGAAASDLRAQIAERRLRKANIVLDQTQHFCVCPALVVNFHRADLQPFLEDIPRHARAETGAAAADIDPVGTHGQEAKQLVVPKEWRVDRHVV